jgi:hypothetical protein
MHSSSCDYRYIWADRGCYNSACGRGQTLRGQGEDRFQVAEKGAKVKHPCRLRAAHDVHKGRTTGAVALAVRGNSNLPYTYVMYFPSWVYESILS